jgi:hypothetical protein
MRRNRKDQQGCGTYGTILLMAFAVTVMVSGSNQREEQIQQEKDESSLFLHGRESRHSEVFPDFTILCGFKHDLATHMSRQ